MGTIFQTRNAEIFERGQYLTPGRYVLQIERTIYKTTQAGFDALIVETTVEESTNPEHPVGSRRTYLAKRNQSFQSNAKAFALAVLGCSTHLPEQIQAGSAHTDDALEAAIDPMRNAFQGLTVAVDVVQVRTKAGEPFSAHNWEPSGRHTLAQALAHVQGRKPAAMFTAPGAFVPPPPPPPPPPPGPAEVYSEDGRYVLRSGQWVLRP